MKNILHGLVSGAVGFLLGEMAIYAVPALGGSISPARDGVVLMFAALGDLLVICPLLWRSASGKDLIHRCLIQHAIVPLLLLLFVSPIDHALGNVVSDSMAGAIPAVLFWSQASVVSIICAILRFACLRIRGRNVCGT